jgi:hypothetical protein
MNCFNCFTFFTILITLNLEEYVDMKIKYNLHGTLGRLALGIITLSASPILSGCVIDSTDSLPQNIGASFSESIASSPVCYSERYEQPFVPTTNKLDLLFVVDSSGSLSEERDRIGNGVDKFIAELPEGADFQIGVLLAHGSRSSLSGGLYKSGISGDSWVLDSKLLSITSMRSILRRKLANPPSDYYADGGEESLFALNRAIQGTLLETSRSRGFFRADAALAIVFVADENDICARYPANVTRVADPDRLEAPAFQRDCVQHVAAATVNGVLVPAHDETITPALVVNNLRALQAGRPLIISGIVYATQNYPHFGENEYGYGYMEAIQQADGIAIDLALNDFETGLSDIGKFTANKINLQSTFVLKHDHVDPTSIEIFVDNIQVGHSYSEVNNSVNLTDSGKSLSDIEINYCQVPAPSPSPSPGCTGISCGVFGT